MIKKIFLSFIGIIVLIFVIVLVFDKSKTIETVPNQSESPTISIEEKPISVIFTGDIMLDRGVEYMVNKNLSDWTWPFLEIADYLKTADFVVGNLEGPISNKGQNVGSIYSFRFNPETLKGLNFAGFNILSLANNHALDYGKEALEDSFTRIKNTRIDFIGAGFTILNSDSPLIKEIRGTKIGFLAYSDKCPKTWAATLESSGINCISLKDLELVKNIISEAKKQTDILFVLIHSGEEYTQTLSDFQKIFSKSAIDSGADLVIGHHPHVVQKNEVYNGKQIFYSLGNFIFDQGFSKETMEGKILKVIIENKKIKEIIPQNIKINPSFQPEIAN